MRCVGRLFGLLLILLILVVTPCAFWTFNIDRVAMNPQTYKTALQTQNFYESFLPAFIDITAVNSKDPGMKQAAESLVEKMSPAEWGVLSEKLLPANWLQEQLDGNIDRIFAWISGKRSSPDIGFDLTLLKQQLTNSQDTALAASLIVPNLPPCTSEQETLLSGGALKTEDRAKVLCKPATEQQRSVVVSGMSDVLNTFGQNMPESWQLADHLREAPIEIDSATGKPVPPEIQMNRMRSLIWLDSQLVLLGFLVPIGLFALVIIVAVRSSKQFFRWLGWGLILSGIITLIPVPLFLPLLLHGAAGMPASGGIEEGRIVNSLMGGIFTSILGGLNLAVFTQVAVVIVIGIVALFLSVLLSRPDEVTRDEIAMERAQLAQMGSTPRPYPSTVTEPFTPPPAQTPTPPPAAYNPADLDDLFNDLPTSGSQS